MSHNRPGCPHIFDRLQEMGATNVLRCACVAPASAWLDDDRCWLLAVCAVRVVHLFPPGSTFPTIRPSGTRTADVSFCCATASRGELHPTGALCACPMAGDLRPPATAMIHSCFTPSRFARCDCETTLSSWPATRAGSSATGRSADAAGAPPSDRRIERSARRQPCIEIPLPDDDGHRDLREQDAEDLRLASGGRQLERSDPV